MIGVFDDYAVHKTQAVKGLCFERGFIIIMFGGGCTGILQWNDTGLHQRLSALIQELGPPAGAGGGPAGVIAAGPH